MGLVCPGCRERPCGLGADRRPRGTARQTTREVHLRELDAGDRRPGGRRLVRSHGLRAYTVDGKPLWAVNVGRVSAGAAAGRTFRHLATNDIGEPVMATPALSRGLIYVRGKNSLFAIGQQTKR